ncbi:hypothetical protein [Cryptosporangium aurantiacum]|uniref:Uncharacterized protein n=1 Tax=Cryptosporangium aurantiacum TaxID=134849 RepID=A0A1M7RJG9_9ACTN|nr:hypothetical protein [Cryptosporangium aurantiacum]SHN46447.1 hypothetical protein SAMN05443668_115136 [Cryptosporangium aurantiacum]
MPEAALATSFALLAATSTDTGGAALARLIVLAFVVGIVAWFGWRISLRKNPYTACRSCKGQGMKHGRIYRHAMRHCGGCSGSGHVLRLGARHR